MEYLTFEQIKNAAYKRMDLSKYKKLTAPEHNAYQAMFYLYKSYGAGFIKDDEAKTMTEAHRESYEKYLLYFRANEKGYKNLVATGNAIAECGKNAENCECCKKISSLWGFLDKTSGEEQE